MRTTFQRTLTRKVSDYQLVAAEIERFCADNQLPTSLTFKVRLIAEELVLNLIDHAVGPVTDRIELRLEVESGRVVLVLEDDGAPFDPRSAPPFDKTKPLAERGRRGMGIQLVRSLTESIEYERIDVRNRLTAVIGENSKSE